MLRCAEPIEGSIRTARMACLGATYLSAPVGVEKTIRGSRPLLVLKRGTMMFRPSELGVGRSGHVV